MGNTEIVAGVIQRLTGAESFKIEPLHEYSKDYMKKGLAIRGGGVENAEPAIKKWLGINK